MARLRKASQAQPAPACHALGTKLLDSMKDAGLRYFELGAQGCSKTIAGLLQLPRLLTADEIRWLAACDPLPTRLARKVAASLRSDPETMREALTFLRRAYPEAAGHEPGADQDLLREWWLARIAERE